MTESTVSTLAWMATLLLAAWLARRLWTQALSRARMQIQQELERKYAQAVNALSQQSAAEQILRNYNAELCQIQSALEQQARELAIQAQADALTGLWNRHYLHQAMQEHSAQAKQRQRAFSCLIVDLDHFKSINDRFGHPVGDEALQRAAGVIREAVRADDIVCRYGGEEFVVLMPGAPIDGAERLAERIRVAVAGVTLSHQGQQIPLTCSIGVATFDPAGEIELLEAADQALYAAKRTGRNRVCIHPACEMIPDSA